MTTSQGTPFTEAEQALAAVARALSHPARVAIGHRLAARAACTCGELVAELPLSQSTVSQHLKALQAAGLIQRDAPPARGQYGLVPAGWMAARHLLGGLLPELLPPTAP